MANRHDVAKMLEAMLADFASDEDLSPEDRRAVLALMEEARHSMQSRASTDDDGERPRYERVEIKRGYGGEIEHIGKVMKDGRGLMTHADKGARVQIERDSLGRMAVLHIFKES